MKVIGEGHSYDLENFEGGDIQKVVFIKKELKENATILETVHDGTTNEEVLKMLIDRMQYLQGKMPCRENAIVITKLEESLMWLNKRTQERIERNVEGTHSK